MSMSAEIMLVDVIVSPKINNSMIVRYIIKSKILGQIFSGILIFA